VAEYGEVDAIRLTNMIHSMTSSNKRSLEESETEYETDEGTTHSSVDKMMKVDKEALLDDNDLTDDDESSLGDSMNTSKTVAQDEEVSRPELEQ